MDMKVFFEIHGDNHREGPGDRASTLRALSYIRGLPENPSVLDVGSGPGAQTIDLAGALPGTVTALDNHQPFLDEIEKRARRAGIFSRVKTVNGTMTDMPFLPDSFDLIWSEGAVYQMGLESGLLSWKKYLKPGGFMALSHIVWLRRDPPPECLEFWKEHYPEITTIENNLMVIAKCGYELKGHFTLPQSAWLDSYYASIENKLGFFEEKYQNDPGAMETIAAERQEIAFYRRYSAYYGYEFFIIRK